MGQDAHRKWKEWKNLDDKAKKYPQSDSRQIKALQARLEYERQEIEDEKDYWKGYNLLSRYEY